MADRRARKLHRRGHADRCRRNVQRTLDACKSECFVSPAPSSIAWPETILHLASREIGDSMYDADSVNARTISRKRTKHRPSRFHCEDEDRLARRNESRRCLRFLNACRMATSMGTSGTSARKTKRVKSHRSLRDCINTRAGKRRRKRAKREKQKYGQLGHSTVELESRTGNSQLRTGTNAARQPATQSIAKQYISPAPPVATRFG